MKLNYLLLLSRHFQATQYSYLHVTLFLAYVMSSRGGAPNQTKLGRLG